MTKYLGQRSNDIVVTMFQNLDTTVTKFLGDYDITIIEFLDTVLPKYLEDNDISVTKFLDSSIDQFLDANDISVTKFLDERNTLDNGDISVTKFLTDTAVSNFPLFGPQAPNRRPPHPDRRPPPAPPLVRKDPLSPHNKPKQQADGMRGGSWDDDLMHDYGPHVRTVYPHGDVYGRAPWYEYERARTVYPADYRRRSNQFDMPYAETRRHVEPPYKAKKKDKKHKEKETQAEKEAKEAIKRQHEAERKLAEEH